MVRLTRFTERTQALYGPGWHYILVLVLSCGFLAGTSLRAATLTAVLDRDTITLGESANLGLVCSDGDAKAPPALPQIPNLEVAFLGRSSQLRYDNGQVSSSVTYNYTLTPRQPGDYVIPSITTELGGQKIATQPLQLKVLKPNAPPAAVASGSQLAFMKLVLPKKEAYVGEALTAQLQLYLSSRVQNIGGFQVTAFPAEGFNVGKMVEGQHRQARIGDTIYTMIPLSYALTAIKAGNYTVGPVSASVVLDVTSGTRRRDPFFEQFGMRDPFERFNTERQQVPLATDAQPIALLAVPLQNAPTNYTGAVGSYTMSVTAGPTNLTEGDPITIKVQISGRGAIESLVLPELAWPNFKTLSQETKVETPDQLGLQGTKTFERIVTPEKAEVKAIPPVSFSFFDPEAKMFRTLSQGSFPLTVRPGGAAPVPLIAALPRARQEQPPPTQDILPNKQRLGTLSEIAPPFIERPWFLAVQGAPVLALVSAVYLRRRADNLAHNPRLRRERQVAQTVRDGLVELRRLAAAKNSDEFFATVFRLLQERLGERLNVSASAITEAVIEERLRPQGVPASTLSPLEQLFQSCNQARYAPIKSSQELAALVPKVENVLSELEKIEV